MVRRLVHLSDLHFGRIDEATLEPLVQFIKNQKFDLVVLSGDLTQRARKEQFSAAKKFLDSIPVRQVIVPGNHDVPLWKFWIRFYAPFRSFMNLITKDLEPTFVDDEIAVLGVNTVSLWSKEGSFRSKKFHKLAERFKDLPPELLKILVTHHPMPVEKLESSGLDFDLVLAGHEHRPGFSIHTIEKEGKHLTVQAGTATSTRLRHGLTNSFNVIEVNGFEVKIFHYDWMTEKKEFYLAKEGLFHRTNSGWLSKKSSET